MIWQPQLFEEWRLQALSQTFAVNGNGNEILSSVNAFWGEDNRQV